MYCRKTLSFAHLGDRVKVIYRTGNGSLNLPVMIIVIGLNTCFNKKRFYKAESNFTFVFIPVPSSMF